MIITRTPFRISFCGGGSDIAEFYGKHGGCVLSTSIDKYMYISIHPQFDENITVLKYSKTEMVSNIKEIEHRIFNVVLNGHNVQGVEISSSADVPAGTGLGSSSAFTVGLLNALYCYKGKYVGRNRLAEEACEIEIEKLKEPIGKQDQYATAIGGLNFIRFCTDGSVTAEPVIMNKDTHKKLQENLIMFYTGKTRAASDILKVQKQNLSKADKVNGMIELCRLTEKMKQSLEQNNLDEFGRDLHSGWEIKKTMSAAISNEQIDSYYNTAIANGAMGGKLLGAGGGGFLLFYCEKGKRQKLKDKLGLKELEFLFDNFGTSVLFSQ